MFSYFGHCIYSAIQLSSCKCVLNKLSCCIVSFDGVCRDCERQIVLEIQRDGSSPSLVVAADVHCESAALSYSLQCAQDTRRPQTRPGASRQPFTSIGNNLSHSNVSHANYQVFIRTVTARREQADEQQYRQTLLKAKYCPQVAAVAHKNPRDIAHWPMTLKFNVVLAVVKIHARAKFHQATCSGSWVIVVTEKKNFATVLKQYCFRFRRQ